LLRVAPWVVTTVVSNDPANYHRGPPCRTAYLVRRGDLVRDLARAVEITPASQREQRIALHLATGGPLMTTCVRNAAHPRLGS
jgi:mRNA-degrading endonuclease toxin of MazEF toxin-antitoxin module